jgi:hypothetical protein
MLDIAPFKYSFFMLLILCFLKAHRVGDQAFHLTRTEPVCFNGKSFFIPYITYNKGDLWPHFSTAVAYEQ